MKPNQPLDGKIHFGLQAIMAIVVERSHWLIMKSWLSSAGPTGMIRTVEQLKWKLCDHFPSGDPIDWKILRVEVLHNNWWLNDVHTVHAAGLNVDLEVTIIYARNEIEAGDDLDTTKYCQVNIPQASGTEEDFLWCLQALTLSREDCHSGVGLARLRFFGKRHHSWIGHLDRGHGPCELQIVKHHCHCHSWDW